MKARASYVLIALTMLTAASAVWTDWRAVAFTLCAYGLHRARPFIVEWFDD